MSKVAKQKASVETRRFGMHPQLLMDVIQRQAGSLSKAILEGVMNSIDAGASQCQITISSTEVSITDDGKGITERVQVEKFFETFGQPHSTDEGKVYGTFRMGRGQMFAYGANRWRTGQFEMCVDVKHKGLDYALASGLSLYAGCYIQICLYSTLLPSDLVDTERTIKKWVKYAPIPIFVNGMEASQDPVHEKWDYIIDEAYIRLNGESSLSVYNLGIHTMDLGAYRLGVGGVIVTRQQLRVNFARNDVQSDCAVWGKIKPFVDLRAQVKISKNATLSDAERQRVCDLISQNESPHNAGRLPLFTTVNGRHYSAEKIVQSICKYGRRFTHCKKGDRLGDKLFQQRVAFVMADETMERFHVGLSRLIPIIYRLAKCTNDAAPIAPFSQLVKGLVGSYNIVDDLTVVEKMWLDLASRSYYELAVEWRDRSVSWSEKPRRKLLVGESDIALGWTDGETYIAMERHFLRKLRLDARGIAELGALLLHEWCHDDGDTGSHIHGLEFYEKFHNSARLIGDFVHNSLSKLPNIFKVAGRELTKEALKNADRAEKESSSVS